MSKDEAVQGKTLDFLIWLALGYARKDSTVHAMRFYVSRHLEFSLFGSKNREKWRVDTLRALTDFKQEALFSQKKTDLLVVELFHLEFNQFWLERETEAAIKARSYKSI
jgi:hypothetical protein